MALGPIRHPTATPAWSFTLPSHPGPRRVPSRVPCGTALTPDAACCIRCNSAPSQRRRGCLAQDTRSDVCASQRRASHRGRRARPGIRRKTNRAGGDPGVPPAGEKRISFLSALAHPGTQHGQGLRDERVQRSLRPLPPRGGLVAPPVPGRSAAVRVLRQMPPAGVGGSSGGQLILSRTSTTPSR